MLRRKYTVEITMSTRNPTYARATELGMDSDPFITTKIQHGKYWTRWFTANKVAAMAVARLQQLWPGAYVTSKVVER